MDHRRCNFSFPKAIPVFRTAVCEQTKTPETEKRAALSKIPSLYIPLLLARLVKDAVLGHAGTELIPSPLNLFAGNGEPLGKRPKAGDKRLVLLVLKAVGSEFEHLVPRLGRAVGLVE